MVDSNVVATDMTIRLLMTYWFAAKLESMTEFWPENPVVIPESSAGLSANGMTIDSDDPTGKYRVIRGSIRVFTAHEKNNADPEANELVVLGGRATVT